MHNVRHRALERVRERPHVGFALLGATALGLLLRGLQLLDADQFLLEGFRRPGIVAHLVTAFGIGNLDVAVAAGEFQQHFADMADRTADRDRAEYRHTGENGDHEYAQAEGDPADCHRLRVRSRLALAGGRDQRLRRRSEQ